jgi:hypothetical protein
MGRGLVIGFIWHFHAARDYTLLFSIAQRLLLSVTVFTALLGNVFRRWTFPCFRALRPLMLVAISLISLTLPTAVWGSSRNRSGQVRVRVTLRLTVSQSVCLGIEPNLGQLTRICLLLEISFRQLLVCNFVAPSLTRGRVCKLLNNCFWSRNGSWSPLYSSDTDRTENSLPL